MLVEIGPGRGDFLFWLAEARPEETVVGIEYKRKRHEKLVRRLERRALSNVRLLQGDARALLPRQFQNESIKEIYILFSDPWPKNRHARRRLFQEGWIEELCRALGGGGRIFVATDDPRYKEAIQEYFRRYPILTFREDGLNFPTFYAQKWAAEGRTLHSFSYEKREDAESTVEST